MTAARMPITLGRTRVSVFTGADICHEAGLTLPNGIPRPFFDDDRWDLAEVVGLPVQLALQHRRFDFTAIGDPLPRAAR